MSKKIKEYFKNYPDDVHFSKDIDEVKKHIEFSNKSQEKDLPIKSWMNWKTVIAVLIAILIVAPTTFLIGYFIDSNNMIPIGGEPNDEFQILEYLEEQFDSHVGASIKTIGYSDDLLISFYLGRNNGVDYLVAYVNSEINYVISFKENEVEKLLIYTEAVFIDMYAIEYSSFELEMTISYQDDVLQTRVLEFDLEEFLNLLK